MSRIKVLYTESARKDLKKLEKKDASRIVLAVKRYSGSSPLEKARALSGLFDGLYRYRVGNYRVIFQYDESGGIHILTILRIKHRKDVYR